MAPMLMTTLLLLMGLMAISHCGAFMLAPFLSRTTKGKYASCMKSRTSLLVKKKRKRRTETADDDEDPDALPDFDLKDDIVLDSTSSANPSAKKPAEMGMSLNSEIGSDEILREAMKGSGSKGIISAKDLLRERDRNLEQSFEFDEVSTPLPTLGKVKDELQPIGKKKAKAEARREAAIKAAAADESSSSIDDLISALPFVGKKPGEKTTPIKLLETGAWAGIAILVVWELYLNSPLFERAAPLAPVVY